MAALTVTPVMGQAANWTATVVQPGTTGNKLDLGRSGDSTTGLSSNEGDAGDRGGIRGTQGVMRSSDSIPRDRHRAITSIACRRHRIRCSECIGRDCQNEVATTIIAAKLMRLVMFGLPSFFRIITTVIAHIIKSQ